MTAAERVKAYLDARLGQPWSDGDLIAWVVLDDHEAHDLTVADLREILAENAHLRAQDRASELRVAEAYRDAFGLRPWEVRQMDEQEARRQA